MERTRRSTTQLVVVVPHHARAVFGYRGLLVSGQSFLALTIGRRKIDASASRCFLFPLTMLHLSLILTSRCFLFPLGSRRSVSLFLIRDFKMLFLPGPTPFGYESATGVGERRGPSPTGAVRGAVVSAETAICVVRQGQKRRGGVSSNLPPSL
jgi:hypothetical protein